MAKPNRINPLSSDLDFMSELEAAHRLTPAWQANMMLWTIMGLFVFLLLWAALSEVEIQTRGKGQVVPSSETQLVQSLEGGILTELNVHEGDRVQKGQILARIDDVAFSSEERGMEAQSLALKMKRARLNAEINNEIFVLPGELKAQNEQLAANETALYESRKNELHQAISVADETVKKNQANLNEIDATIKRLQESVALLSQELTITRDLVAKNAMPKVEALKQEREYSELSGNLSAARERKVALQAELSSARSSREEAMAKFKSDALHQLSEVETKLSAMKESLTAAGDRVDRTELRAPSNGVVKKINQKTIGGIVEPAMKLIEITPLGDDLKVTAKIAPADIAFLKVDQPVNVKITAYDAQKFGSLHGRLTRISADTIEDREGNIFFEIDVVTDKNYLGTMDNPLPITPGMVAEVDIITGKRTILSYMAKPFLRARDRAMREQ